MYLITVLAVSITLITAVAPRPNDPAGRIVGGSVAFIWDWPSQASILFAANGVDFRQSCGGTLISSITILSAAHCVRTPSNTHPASRYRIRLGSTWANSGGRVYNVANLIIYPDYNVWTLDADVVLFRSALRIDTTDVISTSGIATSTQVLNDNEPVTIIGWGRQWDNGPFSEQLRAVQVRTVNQNVCALRYGDQTITANMLCSGQLDEGGRDACQGDFGGPVFHNNVVVGISSFGRGCATAMYPGVSVRVSRFSSWIVSNA